jgi:hypothetical protein
MRTANKHGLPGECTRRARFKRWTALSPLRPGQVERRSHDYQRHGTTSLFAALELKTSRVIGQLHHCTGAIAPPSFASSWI